MKSHAVTCCNKMLELYIPFLLKKFDVLDFVVVFEKLMC